MNLCNLALFLLIAALVFYLIASCCAGGKTEKFCAGTCKVRNMNTGCLDGAGRSDCPSNCTSMPKNRNTLAKQYEQKYFIEGMDDRKTIANYIAKKALENYRPGTIVGDRNIELAKLDVASNTCVDNQITNGLDSEGIAYVQQAAINAQRQYLTRQTKDSQTSVGNPFSASATGQFAVTGDTLRCSRDKSIAKFQALKARKEGFAEGDDLYENFEDSPQQQEDGEEKEGFAVQVGNVDKNITPCGLPASMYADRCADPNTYVYDRQIAVVSKSRTYGQGNYLLGDLPICPAAPTDSYGSDWFRPSARPSADLNAGALRFMLPDNSSVTNITGDVNVVRDSGCAQSNLDVQYVLAGSG